MIICVYGISCVCIYVISCGAEKIRISPSSLPKETLSLKNSDILFRGLNEIQFVNMIELTRMLGRKYVYVCDFFMQSRGLLLFFSLQAMELSLAV